MIACTSSSSGSYTTTPSSCKIVTIEEMWQCLYGKFIDYKTPQVTFEGVGVEQVLKRSVNPSVKTKSILGSQVRSAQPLKVLSSWDKQSCKNTVFVLDLCIVGIAASTTPVRPEIRTSTPSMPKPNRGAGARAPLGQPALASTPLTYAPASEKPNCR